MKRHATTMLLSGILIGGLILTGGVVTGALAHPFGSSLGAYPTSRSMGSPQQSTASNRALTINQAQQQVRQYMRQYGNPHLVIDEVLEFQHNFYAIVKDTSTGHGAFEVLVNKWSGLVFPEYGPAMMWNTQYGMMGTRMAGGGMMGSGSSPGPMTISSPHAAQIARQWLARYRPGTTIETPDQFPGYYTVYLHKGGTIVGMLSVNGHSGRVWNHNWHGGFIRLQKVNG